MNKLFKPKCMRRILLCLALLFPIVYLCGGLFFGLAGANGTQLWADYPIPESFTYSSTCINGYDIDNTGNVISSPYVCTSNYFDIRDGDSSYRITFTLPVSPYTKTLYYYDSDYSFIGKSQASYNSLSYYDFTPLTGSKYARFTLSNYGYSFDINIIASGTALMPSISSTSYSDYIFSQPFANNNFISALGKDLVNGSTKGFNPMNELFRTINTNIMHFEVTDGLAMFGFGYVYYAVNVLIIYEVLILAVKLLMLPLKAVDVFDRKGDYDD